MPYNSKTNYANVTSLNKKVASITSFGGVDYSSQKFNVAMNRAIDIKNFIYKDGVIQKRTGYEHIFVVPKFGNNPTNINNMWKFKAEDNNEHIIAHIGHLLCEIKNIGTKDMEVVKLSDFEFENFKSQAFVGAKRLWFLGGNKFMCLRFTDKGAKLYEVEDRINSGDDTEDTFIPTTTIGITYANARVSGSSGLDYPNKMTMWRENKLVSGVGKEEDSYTTTDGFEYTLDAPLIWKNKKDIENIEIVIEERGTI